MAQVYPNDGASMTIGEVVAGLGVEAAPGEDVVLTVIDGGRVVNYTLPEIEDEDPDDYPSLYLATGTFMSRTVTRHAGRKVEHVRRLLWLPFDCDLTDWIGEPAPRVHGLSDDALGQHLADQRLDITETFADLGIPIHRLDVTGYGHCAYVRLDADLAGDVAGTRTLHKATIERVNERVAKLVDPQASDAGTRITRLPGSVNNKASTPRPVVTVLTNDGVIDRAALSAVAKAQPAAPVTPIRTDRLGEDLIGEIVEALAPHWVEGQRHAMAVALGGMLAKAGVAEASALAIVERLSAGDAEPGDRRLAVRRSYDRMRLGQTVAGYTAMKGLLPDAVLSWLDGRLQRVSGATTARITVGGKAAGPKPNDPAFDETVSSGFSSVPESAFHGWFGAYRDLMAPTSEASDAFHLGAALTLAGAMIGRRICTHYASDSLYANLYTVLIGTTGRSRKDTAIKRALSLPQRNETMTMRVPAFKVSRDVSSAEGVVGMLKDQPNTLLYLTELATLLRNAKRKGTSTILDRLIEAWDTPDILQNLSKGNPLEASRPYLSILSAVQPSRLASEMTDEDIHSGFANRWLYITGSGKTPMATPPPVDNAKAWATYLTLFEAIGSYPEGTVLMVDPEARKRWDTWYEMTTKWAGRDEEEDAMRVRHASLIQKIALIYAVSDRAATIEDRHIAAAMSIVDWMWHEVQGLMRLWGVGVRTQIEERIKTVLTRDGAMRRRDLQRKCSNRKWSAQDFAQAFKAMAENGTVEIDDRGVVQCSECR